MIRTPLLWRTIVDEEKCVFFFLLFLLAIKCDQLHGVY